MLKRIKLQNSTVLLIGILFVVLGVVVGVSDYLKQKKDKAYTEMNLLLYENEIPDVIESEQKIEENQEKDKSESEGKQEQPREYRYNYIGTIEIPKINLKQGFLDLNSRYNNVDYNITVIKGSTFPDENNNNLILASHSGPCSVCYFDKLYKLSIGDVTYISYKGVKYSYKIVNIYEVTKDGTVAIYRDYSKNVLTLITCTRNTNDKQTVYILEEF